MTATTPSDGEAVIGRAVRFAMAALHLRDCPADENVHFVCECGKEEAIDLLREMASANLCEFCGQQAPEDQYHPSWHDDGAPMRACDECMKCSHCDGTGKHVAMIPEWDEDPCSDCGGTGADSGHAITTPEATDNGSEAPS